MHALPDQHVEERARNARMRALSGELEGTRCNRLLRLHLQRGDGDARDDLPSVPQGFLLHSGRGRRLQTLSKRDFLQNHRYQRVHPMPVIRRGLEWGDPVQKLYSREDPLTGRRVVRAVPVRILLRVGRGRPVSAGLVLARDRPDLQNAVPSMPGKLFL